MKMLFWFTAASRKSTWARIDYDDAIVTPHNAAGWLDEADDQLNSELDSADVSEVEDNDVPIIEDSDTAASTLEAPRD